VKIGGNMEKIRIVNCPQCGNPVEWRPENAYRPFCSQRCKLIDLGAWASEDYRVPTSPPDSGDNPANDDA